MSEKSKWRKVNLFEAIETCKERIVKNHRSQNLDFFESVEFTDGTQLVIRPDYDNSAAALYFQEKAEMEGKSNE